MYIKRGLVLVYLSTTLLLFVGAAGLGMRAGRSSVDVPGIPSAYIQASQSLAVCEATLNDVIYRP